MMVGGWFVAILQIINTLLPRSNSLLLRGIGRYNKYERLRNKYLFLIVILVLEM